jgi:hypothetical protein
MLFCIAFLFQFLVAGLTGIMLASAPFNWQLTGSYFVVAHFHYVIVGGILFCVFAAFYYWFPKMTGRMLSERLGKVHFWLFVIGFHLTFDFMHIPGILGMPRRIYTYEASRGWETWNLIVTIGVLFQAAGILVFAGNLLRSYFRGNVAGNDPWDAWTYEWATTSPPPVYNFATLPVARSRRPLWDLKHPEDPDWKYESAEPFREVKVEDDKFAEIPASTASPILLAFGIALLFAGLVTAMFVGLVGVGLTAYASVAWFRDVLPREKQERIPTVVMDPVSTKHTGINQIHWITGHPHRARLPVEMHPISAGVRGGLAGGAVMAVLVLFWGALSGHSLWYPANLLAAGFFPGRVTTAELVALHWDSLIIGIVIFAFAALLFGLLYGAILPMLPRHPVFLTSVVVPICVSALAYSFHGTVNPILRTRIDLPWFIVFQVAFGIVAGIVVSRSERIRTWQHASFSERAGIEEDGTVENDGGTHV